MRRYSDGQILRLGAISLMVMALITAATFNLGRFPGFAGTDYTAYFTDASGLRTGSSVQVGGIRSGRVAEVSLEGEEVRVVFELDTDVEIGPESTASVETLNLLGEKYLNVTPAGEGVLDPDVAIPSDRTAAAYDIVGVFGDLTTTVEDVDTDQLVEAFDVLGDTVEATAPEIEESLRGITRLSQTVSSRDAELGALLDESVGVSRLLAERSDDLVALMGDSRLVFEELQRRRDAIHRLLVNARVLARELRGVAEDNQEQIGPALREVEGLLDTLLSREKELKATLNALGPYVSILGNIIGTGPWFDAYAVNLLAIPTGEFVPGAPEVLQP